MARGAKGSPGDSGLRTSRRGGLWSIACVCALALGALLGTSAPAAAAAECPNEALRTGASANLPDCRAYEQVSPVAKNGNYVIGEKSTVQAAPDGSGLTFLSIAILPGSEGANQSPIYIADRGDGLWSTTNLLAPASMTGPLAYILGWTEDEKYAFSIGKWGAVGYPYTIYMRNIETGAVREVATGFRRQMSYATSSADDSVVVFESKDKLPESDAIENKYNIYVWDRESGQTTVASVLNDGTPPTSNGSYVGAAQWWVSTPREGGPTATYYSETAHALSADGSRLFFSSGSRKANGEVQVYVRENPTQEQSAMAGEECTEAGKACTVQISAPERTTADPNGAQPAWFIGASRDGSKAFFLSAGALTDNATTGTGDEGTDLYRYDADAPAGSRLTDLVPDPSDSAGAEIKGVLGISADGSDVYFAAAAALPGTGAPAGTCSGSGKAVTGTCDIYLWHEDQTTHQRSITFVAQVEADRVIYAGQTTTGERANWSPQESQPGTGAKEEPTARVSANGTLIFTSAQQLTTYANGGVPELYRYQPGASSALSCVSCNPSPIVPPVGAMTLRSDEPTIGPPSKPTVLTRNISADGNRVFFESPDKLVAADVNGEGGCPEFQLNEGGTTVPICLDVYEWEAKGTGSCHSTAQNGGCLYLISTGTSTVPSFFADNSESGDDASIFTLQRLVGQDKDELQDAYDARVDGGIAAQNLPAPVPCEGEACKAGPMSPPTTSSPGSASFSGPGNKTATQRGGKKHHHKKHHKKRRRHHRAAPKKHGKGAKAGKKGRRHNGKRNHREGRGR